VSEVPDDSASAVPRYVCVHDRREIDRLALQARIYDPMTRRLLVRAGLGQGMKVIDVGCGGGDVSLLAGELVGSAGSVEGVDRSPESLAAAAARATGMSHVRFVEGDLETWRPSSVADAVIGRFVLMHQRDPAGLLARFRGWVRPGGVVAFVESDITACEPGRHSHPHSTTYDEIVKIWQRAIRAAGAQLDLGPRLAACFESAGFATPSVEVDHYRSGEPGSPIFRFAVESARSMLAAGAPLPDPAALEAEVRALGGWLSAPPAYAVWARASHDGARRR
jgi:ubiquinone/menaquinone biosynthesis C-methylase UbiE